MFGRPLLRCRFPASPVDRLGRRVAPGSALLPGLYRISSRSGRREEQTQGKCVGKSGEMKDAHSGVESDPLQVKDAVKALPQQHYAWRRRRSERLGALLLSYKASCGMMGRAPAASARHAKGAAKKNEWHEYVQPHSPLTLHIIRFCFTSAYWRKEEEEGVTQTKKSNMHRNGQGRMGRDMAIHSESKRRVLAFSPLPRCSRCGSATRFYEDKFLPVAYHTYEASKGPKRCCPSLNFPPYV
eukprot:gene9693-6790_t